jgi:hypothetical protein
MKKHDSNIDVERLTAQLRTHGRIPVDIMDRAATTLGIDWPGDYRAFMVEHGGGEGWVGPGYLALWRADELVENNQSAGVRVNAPHLVGIGGDGGDELFAFDRSTYPPVLVMVPLIGLDHPVQIGTFTDLLRRLAADNLFGA